MIHAIWQLHLEELVDKDAAEKSDAAREAFLAELALADKKNINRGGNSKQSQDKLKDKKKNKDNRKPKDIKVRSILSVVKFLILRLQLSCISNVFPGWGF